MRTLLLATLAIAALVPLACDGDMSAGQPTTASSAIYLSLGDSVAAGNGASDPRTTSFAARVAADEGLTLVNLAVAGATTTEVIEKQLPEITEAAAGRQVSLITISAGGNDLAALIPNAACQEDPLPATCPLDAALDGVSQRLDTILADLRRSYPDTDIVLLAYPNFFSGTGHVFEAPAARVLPRLGDTIRDIAARHDNVAVATPSFEGRGAELTHVLDERFDPHPNDAGHQLIADAIGKARDRLRARRGRV